MDKNDDRLFVGKDDLSFEQQVAPGRSSRWKCKIEPDLAGQQEYSCKGIFLPDERIPVDETEYPYNCIVRLKVRIDNNETLEGTGFFISERCVITAAHNIYRENGFVEEVIVIPCASKPDSAPHSGIVSKEMYCLTEWAESFDKKCDCGTIILPYNSSPNAKSFAYDRNSGSKQEVEISGYEQYRDEQLMAKGIIHNSDDPHHLYYKIDTESGQSGSPVFIKNDDKSMVLGVHQHFYEFNQAVKVNETLCKIWDEWAKM